MRISDIIASSQSAGLTPSGLLMPNIETVKLYGPSGDVNDFIVVNASDAADAIANGWLAEPPMATTKAKTADEPDEG